jgi:uncharacterized protein YcnI
MKVPESVGPLYFPALQRCDQGAIAWTQVPAKGQSRQDLKQPAPVLLVRKAVGASAEHH